jgi:hypothetical protein
VNTKKYKALRTAGISATTALALALGLQPTATAATGPVTRDVHAHVTTSVGTATVDVDLFYHSTGSLVVVDSMSALSSKPVVASLELFRAATTPTFVRSRAASCGAVPATAIPAWMSWSIKDLGPGKSSGYLRVAFWQGKAKNSISIWF